MMAPGVDKLPDFSKGEELSSGSSSLFQPLFGEPVEQQGWLEDSVGTDEDTCSDLEALVSELDQLPTEVIDSEAEVCVDTELLPESDVVVPPASVLQEEHDAAIDKLRQEHADEIARIKSEHKDQILQHLETLHLGLVEGVADRIEMELTTALLPMFQKDIARTNLEQLIAEIRQLIQSESIERIQLCGPDVLTTAVSMALVGSDLKIDVETKESSDLLVHLNDKILSTSIGDWTRKVEEALGA